MFVGAPDDFATIIFQLVLFSAALVALEKYIPVHPLYCLATRATEIVGFAGSGPSFETENRFISWQQA